MIRDNHTQEKQTQLDMNTKHDKHKMKNIKPISLLESPLLLESLSITDTVSPDWSDRSTADELPLLVLSLFLMLTFLFIVWLELSGWSDRSAADELPLVLLLMSTFLFKVLLSGCKFWKKNYNTTL